MNDADIIKALECCAQEYYCADCPLIGTQKCIPQMSENVINLIKRQKAEIDRLESEIDKQYEQAEADILGNISDGGTSCHWCIDRHKSKAIKEFAERLKKSAFDCDVSFGYGREHYTEAVAAVEIDNLVKEMTEGEQHESV